MFIFQISDFSKRDKWQEKTKPNPMFKFIPTVLHGAKVIDIEAETMGYSKDQITYLVNTYSEMINNFCQILSADEEEGGYGWKQPPKTQMEIRRLISDALPIIWSNFEPGNTVLLSSAIERRTLDCDTSAFILHDILQQFGIDSKFIAPRHHTLLKVGSDYIETTTGRQGPEVIFYNKETFREKYTVFYDIPFSYLTLAYSDCGDARFDNGDYNGAISDYTKAIELNPKFANAFYNRGCVKRKIGDYNGAISDYTKAIELDPNFLDAYYNRGNVRFDNGDYNGAISDYTKAIELNPNLVDAYYNRGNVKYKIGDYNGAISDYTKAIELNPTAFLYSNRGSVKYKIGDYDGAISDYTKAIELNPNLASVYYNRGIAKKMKGDIEGANADFTKAKMLRLK